MQECNLTSLNNCAQVKQGLWAKDNPRLVDLKGIPACEELFISYHPDLALLPALVVGRITVRNMTPHFPDRPDAFAQMKTILNKHAGKGKSAMLNFALDLKKAGFGSNARW